MWDGGVISPTREAWHKESSAAAAAAAVAAEAAAAATAAAATAAVSAGQEHFHPRHSSRCHHRRESHHGDAVRERGEREGGSLTHGYTGTVQRDISRPRITDRSQILLSRTTVHHAPVTGYPASQIGLRNSAQLRPTPVVFEAPGQLRRARSSEECY